MKSNHKKSHFRKVIAVDLDGTLCKEICWTPKQCLDATPIQKTVKKVKELSKTNFIFIFTARRDFLIPATLKWLKKHDIPFEAISNNKASADLYIDDKYCDIDNL